VKFDRTWSILAVASTGLLVLIAAEQVAAQSTYDDIWGLAEWYRNDQNDAVQSVLFSGRFQYEFAAVDADQGTHHEWNVRRVRLGVKSVLFRQFTVHVEAGFNPQERDPFYKRLTDAYVEWEASDDFALKVGKQGVAFTTDGSTSSKELLTIDRSNLANNMWFPDEYIPGISVSGGRSKWVYHLGLYTGGGVNAYFGEFDGSAFGLLSLGYDFSEALGVEDALLRGNYVYQDPDPNNMFTRQLQHIASVNFDFEADPWGFRLDFSAASGYLGQSDLWGVMTMPFFNLKSRWQIVARHTYLRSRDANGVRLARYENQVTDGRGDRYNEFYAGVNYYVYGHKLKLQSGVQYADMNDSAADGGAYSGVAWTTGLRVSW
jgi:phosphate-selective porin OprO/OprP